MRFIMAIFLCTIFLYFSVSAQDYYKIYFPEEGIYRLTGQELANAGIPISQIQPEMIQLFSDGQNILPYSTAEPEPQLQEIAIWVEDGGDGQLHAQDYVLFYGYPLNRFEWSEVESSYQYYSNPYDTLACYWLRWNVEPGKRISLKDGSPLTGNATLRETFTDHLRLEKDRFNNIKSGLTWAWHFFGGVNTFGHSFTLSGVAGTEAGVTARLLRIEFYYAPSQHGFMTISANNTFIGSANNNATLTATVPIFEGTNSLFAQYIPFSSEDTLQQSGFDWMKLLYPRYTHLINDELKIFVDETSGIFHTKYRQVTDPDSIEIFDISDPFNVAQIQTNNDSLFEDTLSVEHKIYYLNRHGFNHSVVSIMPGQRDIFFPADGADYVIITRQETVPQMQPLKSHREIYNGFSVKIVTVEDVADDFGFGRNDPTAIRNFIKFAHSNWNPQPQYILLAGNGYYDYRNISGEYSVNWVPAFEISAGNNISSRATDDFYVDVTFVSSLGSIDAQIPIGRFPADTPAELAAMVNKTIRSELNFKPGLWRLNTLMIADDEFRGGGSSEFFFLVAMEDLVNDYLPSELWEFKLYEREYPFVGNDRPAATRQLINWMNQGSRLVVFYGHGNDQQWTHENLLNFQRDMGSIKNKDKLPIFAGWSMLYKYDDLHEGILQNLLKRENSGFSAIFSSNRQSFAFQNEVLIESFIQKLFNDAQGVIGIAVMMAKTSGANSQKYHLLGDPALKLSLPEERVQITGITPDTLKTRSLVQITGQVNGSAPGDSLLIEVREPGKIIQIPQLSFPYETTGGALYRGYVPVNNGQFTAQFVVSDDIPHDSAAARGRLHAYTWNGLNEGMGFRDSLLIGRVDSGVTDITPPQITLSVTGGGSVSRDAYLIASLSDENGINLSRFSDHYPILFFDGNHQGTINVADFFIYQAGSYQSGVLRYPLPYLANGNHTITLRVHDNYNNAASDSISFITGIEPAPEYMPDRITLAQNYPNPFNPETTIPFSISGSSRYRVRLEIYNVLGQKVHTLVNDLLPPGEYEIKWDGRDRQGNSVASGLYIYRLWISSHAVEDAPHQLGGIYQYSRKMLLLK
jgi:hypothetical protein